MPKRSIPKDIKLGKGFITALCKVCRGNFQRRRILAGNRGIYCSKKCANTDKRIPFIITCVVCGSIKTLQRNRGILKTRQTCSRNCTRIAALTDKEQERLITGRNHCASCKTYKPIQDFTANSATQSGLNAYCRACMSIRSKRFYPAKDKKRARFKAQLVIRLGNKCGHCGAANLPICCYDFHHFGDDKESTISTLLSVLNQHEKLERELAKCEIVCVMCHRIAHSRFSNQSATYYI